MDEETDFHGNKHFPNLNVALFLMVVLSELRLFTLGLHRKREKCNESCTPWGSLAADVPLNKNAAELETIWLIRALAWNLMKLSLLANSIGSQGRYPRSQENTWVQDDIFDTHSIKSLLLSLVSLKLWQAINFTDIKAFARARDGFRESPFSLHLPHTGSRWVSKEEYRTCMVVCSVTMVFMPHFVLITYKYLTYTQRL